MAEDAIDGGAIDWLRFVGIRTVSRNDADTYFTWRQKREKFQTSFSEDLFEMLMVDPGNPMWARADSPFK
jgi:hypothetical protein